MAKAKGKPARERPKQWHCAIGTRNMLGNTYSYVGEGDARGRAVEALEQQRQWCQTYNKSGIDTVNAAISEVANTGLSAIPKEIVCTFDEHTGMTMKITLWQEMPKAWR